MLVDGSLVGCGFLFIWCWWLRFVVVVELLICGSCVVLALLCVVCYVVGRCLLLVRCSCVVDLCLSCVVCWLLCGVCCLRVVVCCVVC